MLDERAGRVSTAPHAPLYRVQDVEVLGDRGLPVELDHLLLFAGGFGFVEPPVSDEERLVDGEGHPTERVQDLTGVALDRRGGERVEGAVRLTAGGQLVAGGGWCLGGVVYAVPASSDAVTAGGDHAGGEGLVHVRTVVALVVVLDHQLPVGVDHLGAPVGERSVGCRRGQGQEVGLDAGQSVGEAGRLVIKVHEHESGEGLDRYGGYAKLADRFATCVQEPSVEVVGPGVVGAGDRLRRAGRVYQQLVSTVLADVVHGMQ